MAGTFIAEIIDDGMAYGKDLQGRLQSIANAATGGGTLPIGAVEWRAGGDPSLPAVTGIAAPLLPYLGQIPLIGEWVLIIEAPTADNNLFSAALGYYYIGPIQIDGEKNHNDLQGLTKRVTSFNTTIPKPLVPIFAKKNVPPVQPLVGDTILQDRNGSSIRMSSTPMPSSLRYMQGTVQGQIPYKTGTPRIGVANPIILPENAGNPIMILTVGHPGQQSKSLKSLAGDFGTPSTMVEDAETAQSIIFMTSDQRIVYRPTRAFKHTGGSAQPLTDKSKVYGAGLYEMNAGYITAYKKASISTNTSFSQVQNDEDRQNPSFGQGKKAFTQNSQYPAQNLSRSQIVIRSHRVNIDAQFDNILLVAAKDIKMGTTNWRVELDSAMQLISELMKQVGLLCYHLQDVGHGVMEVAEIGKKVQFPTGVGPTGPCLTTYNSAYDTLIKSIKTDGYLAAVGKRSAAINDILTEFERMRRPVSEKQKQKKK